MQCNQDQVFFFFTLNLSSTLVTASSVKLQSLNGIKLDLNLAYVLDFIGVFNGKNGCKVIL